MKTTSNIYGFEVRQTNARWLDDADLKERISERQLMFLRDKMTRGVADKNAKK
jgi:hypothetical protein